MYSPCGQSVAFVYLAFLLWCFTVGSLASASKDVYVVYMGSKVHADPDITSAHNHDILASVHEGNVDAAKRSMVYSYKHGFRGFSAKLSASQAAALAKRPEVVTVFKSEMRQLHTTRSWEFLGLPPSEIGGIPHSSRQHSVILGLLDTGIWPESKSFHDHMMPPVPRRWKGKCMEGENFTAAMCNRKLIGARYYLRGLEEQSGPLVPFSKGGSDILSPRDSVGHGCHTASTAAGRFVGDVSLTPGGLGRGQRGARGGAPRARVAVYKVCWSPGCFDSDILAAFDDAIHDGVDVVSLSLGPDPPQGDYFMDALSIGSFHAMLRSITTVGSVGNNGPASAATNVAPWILTVAATSLDRDFPSRVLLGNGVSVQGESLSVGRMDRSAALINGRGAGKAHVSPSLASYCTNNTLDPRKVRGKVVVCRHSSQDVATGKAAKSAVVRAAGGVGLILIDELDRRMGVRFVVPGAIVGNSDGKAILSYMNSTRSPVALITPPSTVVGVKPAPQVSVFSSRGPNTVTPDVLKPDIAAPGLNILAAWSPINMGLDYNIVSGTSMSCPHISGVALLLKASHPSWSPAAIKSAMITTALIRDNENRPITTAPKGTRANPFDMGAGLVYAKRAQNPGLIYDMDGQDYVGFLCSTGYDTATLQLLTSDNRSRCPGTDDADMLTSPADLNYPSIAVSSVTGTRRVRRTVTNVGRAESQYRAKVEAPSGVDVRVLPDTLSFRRFGQNLSFFLEFTVRRPLNGYAFGSLTWTDGRHKVRSPLAIYTG